MRSGDRDETTKAVAAGLCLARLLPPAEVPHRAGPWILATLSERLSLPPVGVIADLGALLVDARSSLEPLRTSLGLPTDDAGLATAMRRYEDAVLGRLAASSRLRAAGDAVVRLPAEIHARAVGILVAGVLDRIGYEAGAEIEPGIVRHLTEKKPAETMRRGYDALRDDADLRSRLTEGYAGLARSAQKARELIGDADLFALENLTVLGTLTQRLAIADVLRAQEAIASRLPRRFPRRRPRGDVATKLEDESVYPVGGFASVTTAGSLENLVTSELIYMDPPAAPGAKADVDLFDMRYVEGELLYYARDEAIFVRRRRFVILALGADLVRARVKDRTLPWQRIVLVLAVVLVLTKKLVELLGEEALEIRVVFVRDEAHEETPLAAEKALAGLMLAEWRDRGTVDILEVTRRELDELANAQGKRARVELVRVGVASSSSPPRTSPNVVEAELATVHDTLEGWCEATAGVLATLL